jgi:hypothetical protein
MNLRKILNGTKAAGGGKKEPVIRTATAGA